MTTYRITTPVADYNGEVGKCHFVKGVYEGPVDDGPLAYFQAQGYGVEELDETPPAEVGDDDGNPATPPPGNASEEAWREHVLTLPGVTEDQVKDLKREQLKELAAQIQEGPKE